MLAELALLRPLAFYSVGDRPMVSQEVLDELESRGLRYLLGLSRRSGWDEIHDAALSIRGCYNRIREILRVEQRCIQQRLSEIRLI